MSDKCRVVVLLSGNGSNFQAINSNAEGCDENLRALIERTPLDNDSRLQSVMTLAASDKANYTVVLAVSNQPEAYGLTRAQRLDIPTEIVNHRNYNSREDFERALIAQIDATRPHLIVMAGFMRKLTPLFVNHYTGRILNIHPSLLPKYRGLNTHQRALAAGEQEHGTSVHFVTEELDGGPLIAQWKVPVLPNDTPEQLTIRVQAAEHQLYPMVVRWFASGLLKMQNGKAFLHGKPIPPQGFPFPFDAQSP